MTIPKLTPYTGQVANPDGSQNQTEFTQNMFDQLSYEAQLAAQLDATIDGMNQAVTDVENSAAAASASATAAEASASTAGYQGLWPDTGGSANKGETWQTQMGGTPTGEYFTALQNTTADPVGDNVNWKVAGTIGQQNLSDYTDIVYKASGGNSAVENMITGIPVAAKIGNVVSTGGTSWKRVSELNSDLTDFKPLNTLKSFDFGAKADGSDDTDALDAMISTGYASLSLESKKTYAVRGDVLYVRRFQTLDLNGSILKLINYINDESRGTVLEMQDYASVINGEIDGNYQNNNFDMDTWRREDGLLHVDESPVAHGIRTGTAGTRTDGNIVPSFKCYIDRVIVRNTIRSNILLSEDSSVGIVYLYGSLCDHHIYFSSARGAYVQYAYCEGPSNSDVISVSSTGESTDLQIGKLKLKNCTMTPWRANSSNNDDKYGSRWIECRENTDGLGLRSTLSIGIVEIDDTTADPAELFDTNRRFRFRDWHVSIDSLVVRTQLAGENLNFEPIFTILDVRNPTTSVNIQNMHVEIDDALAMSYPVRAINANDQAAVNIGNLTGSLNAPNAGTGDNGLGWTRCIDSSITIGTIDTEQSQGDVFWCRVANHNANITVTNNNGTEGYTRPIYNFSSNPELVAKFKQIQSKHEVRPVGDITGNTTIDGFNVETVDLALATGTLQGFKDGYIGQEITVIWNGVCNKAGGNVRWQTTTPATPTDGSVSVLRLGQHNGGMWVETSFTAM